jgi:transposase
MVLGERSGLPLGICLAAASVAEVRLAEATLATHRRHIIHRFQDGRKLRRYRRRWTIERTIAWLIGFKRLTVRCERRLDLYRAFVHVACLWIVLRWL